ncbi:uncharacterized protein LOC134178898 [Corticium candelabrum]|uniref:uncharacterized protein LOC134178898 n=1 Tax=Corticium candelabrum TaxID=121492 RepID=UPI002E2726E3|nr:uncharacterized protein LOC134178898 [Corticium candelabrum]
MSLTVYLPVVFLVALVPSSAATCTTSSLPPHGGLRFIGTGYNLLDGNPQGVHSLGGIDPGFRDTYRVLQLTYDQQKISRDRQHSVADQVNTNERLSCSSSHERRAYTGVKGYQSDLSRSVDASASASFAGLVKFSFTESYGYKSMLRESQSERKVYMEKSRICNLGSVRYQTELAQCPISTASRTSQSVEREMSTPKFQLSPEFEAAVHALPIASATTSTASDASYFSFLDTWGTHVITEIVLGSKYTEQYEMTSDKAFKYSLEHDAMGITTSASVLSAHGSVSLDINSLVQSESFVSTFTSSKKVIHTGSSVYWDTTSNKWIIPTPIRHEPIKITLTPITEFLSCRYTVDSRVLAHKSALARALTAYPSYKNSQAPPDDSLLTLPVAWPRGTYGLVRPTSGCPEGTNSRWEFGWRKHDTEDGDSSNEWSSSYSLSGWKAKNDMQWEFCIKVSNGENKVNYQWPKGTYCILKKDFCPDNFDGSEIYWDDEDSGNANQLGGTLPDGTYDRNTRMHFCCRQDGSTAKRIILPTKKPFILVAATHNCQKVYKMHVSHQYFKWDNEDSRNKDSTSHHGSFPHEDGGTKNHKLHFCYYYKYNAK